MGPLAVACTPAPGGPNGGWKGGEVGGREREVGKGEQTHAEAPSRYQASWSTDLSEQGTSTNPAWELYKASR